MQALFNLLANQGRISSKEKFKKLAERKGLAIWEFKRFQLRFLGGFAANQTVRRHPRCPEEAGQTPARKSLSGQQGF